MNSGDVERLLRGVFAGRPCILALGPVAGQVNTIRRLREFGATRFLVLADSLGTGELPDRGAGVDWLVVVDGVAPDMMTGIRMYEAALLSPSDAVVEAVERFDPDGEAIVMCAHISDLQEICGRECFGAREPSWAALEDKVVIDLFWDKAGIERAPSQTVSARNLEAQLEASAGLDEGRGTVWAGDALEGFNGGAAYLRIVESEEDGARAHEFFATRCEQVRIMPYLEGIPCSIHGMVFPEEVIAFRPVEMIVFRRPGRGQFLYAGFATFWDPSDEDRQEMRAMARRVGEALRREVGYRGAFTVDGIITARGFLPTELNPRSGGAFAWLTRGEPEFPLSLLDKAVRHGCPVDFEPRDLEERVIAIADAHRTGGGWTVVDIPFEETVTHQLLRTEGGFELTAEGCPEEDTHGVLLLGPSAMGGFVRYLPHRHATAMGPSLAPEVAEAFAFVDRSFGTEFGELVPATPQERATGSAAGTG